MPNLQLRFQVSRLNPISPIISKHRTVKTLVEQKNTGLRVSEPNLDYNKMPHLLVTEVVPDSTNVGGADGYEFIEIYNNTNQPINFGDYKMQYRYGTDPETDVIWASVPDEFTIASKGTAVFWIINAQNGNKTVADFNALYHTNLVENKDIVRIYSNGMANGSTRGIIAATNTDIESSVAYYNEESGVDDTNADKGIFYKYPVDGTQFNGKNKCRKRSGNTWNRFASFRYLRKRYKFLMIQ